MCWAFGLTKSQIGSIRSIDWVILLTTSVQRVLHSQLDIINEEWWTRGELIDSSIITMAAGMQNSMVVLLQAASLLMVVMLSMSGAEANSGLKYDFYHSSCKNAEAIVFQKMQEHYATDKTVAPGVLRLMFHDAFVRVSF